MFAKEVYILPAFVLLRTAWAIRTEEDSLRQALTHASTALDEVEVQNPDQACIDATARNLIKDYKKGSWKIDQDVACALPEEDLYSDFWKYKDDAACAAAVQWADSEESKACADSSWASDNCQALKGRAEAWIKGVKKGFCEVKFGDDTCISASATAARKSYAEGGWQRQRTELCRWTANDMRKRYVEFIDVSPCGSLKAYLVKCKDEDWDASKGCDQSRYTQWLEGVHADFCGVPRPVPAVPVVDDGDDSACVGPLAAKMTRSYRDGPKWNSMKGDVCAMPAVEMDESYTRAMRDVPECAKHALFRSSEAFSACSRDEWQGEACVAMQTRATEFLAVVHAAFCATAEQTCRCIAADGSAKGKCDIPTRKGHRTFCSTCAGECKELPMGTLAPSGGEDAECIEETALSTVWSFSKGGYKVTGPQLCTMKLEDGYNVFYKRTRVASECSTFIEWQGSDETEACSKANWAGTGCAARKARVEGFFSAVRSRFCALVNR